jgi:hypothetical protein
MPTDAEYTLKLLFDHSIDELAENEPLPGTTYEVAPGIVGEMGYPTLKQRERFSEIRSGLQEIFREDATAEDFEALGQLLRGEEPEEGQSPIREGLTSQEFQQLTSRVNCEATVEILSFDEEVEPHDISPDMAAVVTRHFTRLRAVGNGSVSAS